MLDRLLAIGLVAGVFFSAYWIAGRLYLDKIEKRIERIEALGEERALLAERRYSDDDIEELKDRTEALREIALSLDTAENQRLALADAEAWLRERLDTTGATLVRVQSKADPLENDGSIVVVNLIAQFECPGADLAEMVSRLEFEGRSLQPLKSLTLRRDDAFRRDDQDPIRLLRGQFEAVKLYMIDPVATDPR